MASMRLVNVISGVVEEFSLDNEPPYIAMSHLWRDGLFKASVPFLQSPGGDIVSKLLNTRAWPVHHCWIDTLCILQDDEEDKRLQIPLMGRIYEKAFAVVALLAQEFHVTQHSIDALTASLQPARQMWDDETWAEEGALWRDGKGRNLIIRGMNLLRLFTHSDWVTRVWTLQEYVLGRRFIWLDLDSVAIEVQDWLFVVLPTICDVLTIFECSKAESSYSRIF